MVSKARDKASYIDRKIQTELDRIGTQYGMPGSEIQSKPVEKKRSRSRSYERRKKSRSRSRERRRRSRSRSC